MVHIVVQRRGLDADQVKRMLMSVLTLKSSGLMTVVGVWVRAYFVQSPLHSSAWHPVFQRGDVDLQIRFLNSDYLHNLATLCH